MLWWRAVRHPGAAGDGYCLAASGTFPTEEKFSLKELIRKCLSISGFCCFIA